MKRRSRVLLRRLDERAAISALSVVAYAELAFGEVVSARREEAAAYLAALLETLQVLPLPLDAARRYAEIRAELQRAGRPIGSNDLWVAAHALAEDLTLVTNNEREFRRVPGLRVENWGSVGTAAVAVARVRPRARASRPAARVYS
jgi:tRNA(fMet)-specific endonuclease VapC